MKSAFEKIKAGLEDAIAFTENRADKSAYGIHVPRDIDVKAMRRQLKLSQSQFAERFGFTAARIRDWEQGRSRPDGALRAYLIVIQKETQAVVRALKTG
jgi:putative transcriptional regulator